MNLSDFKLEEEYPEVPDQDMTYATYINPTYRTDVDRWVNGSVVIELPKNSAVVTDESGGTCRVIMEDDTVEFEYSAGEMISERIAEILGCEQRR